MMMREAHEHTLRKMHPLEDYRPEAYPGGGMVATKIHVPGDNSNENEYAYVWDTPQQQTTCGTGSMPRKYSDPGLPLQRGTLMRDFEKRAAHVQCFEMDDSKLEGRKAPYPL